MIAGNRVLSVLAARAAASSPISASTAFAATTIAAISASLGPDALVSAAVCADAEAVIAKSATASAAFLRWQSSGRYQVATGDTRDARVTLFPNLTRVGFHKQSALRLTSGALKSITPTSSNSELR